MTQTRIIREVLLGMEIYTRSELKHFCFSYNEVYQGYQTEFNKAKEYVLQAATWGTDKVSYSQSLKESIKDIEKSKLSRILPKKHYVSN